jgi:diguanylate cyclase (GGDEF)-like protein
VNGLKFANDAFGHEFGDTLLRKLADTLKSGFRQGEIVARWGGDEFVIILPKTNNDTVREICDRIRRMSDGITVGPIRLSVAFGCATKDSIEQKFSDTIKNAENQMYQNKLMNANSGRSETVSSLLNTMYELNYEVEAHEQRLLGIVAQIGQNLNLMPQEIEELKLLAILHDLGKLGISKEILMKPDRLTQEEWAEIKKHSEIGYRIAESIPGLAHISKYILSVHERWDGLGYPQGIKGNAIPKLSRIVAIVDAYDAMISESPYKKSLSPQEAIHEIIRCSGTQFDPELVDLFVKIDINMQA